METVNPTPSPSREERNWGVFTHLASLSGFIIPLGTVLGPLIVWLVKKGESSFVDQNGREALNFNISMLLYGIISSILILVAIGILLLFAVGIVWLVFTIIAAVRTNEGQVYRYPLTIRFIK